jgi:hypothetical protein
MLINFANVQGGSGGSQHATIHTALIKPKKSKLWFIQIQKKIVKMRNFELRIREYMW